MYRSSIIDRVLLIISKSLLFQFITTVRACLRLFWLINKFLIIYIKNSIKYTNKWNIQKFVLLDFVTLGAFNCVIN